MSIHSEKKIKKFPIDRQPRIWYTFSTRTVGKRKEIYMTVAFCVDDRMGMMFCRKRQSKDRLMRARLLSLCGGAPLYMNPYSGKMFTDEGEGPVAAREDFLSAAGAGDTAFLEDVDPKKIVRPGDRVIVYRWNRHYPSDLKCTLDFTNRTPQSTFEFAGSSHEKITEEIYTW